MDFRSESSKEKPFDVRTTILSLAVVIAAIVIPTQFQDKQKKIEPEPAPIVQVCNTNSVFSATNQVERAGQNLDWFKNTSNYIWDGWKIK